MSAIQSKEVINPGYLSGGPTKEAVDYKAILDGLQKTIDKLVVSSKELSKSADFTKGIEQQKKLQSALDKSTAARKGAIEVDKQKVELSKQLALATDEEVKGKIRLANARKKQKDILKDVVALENKELGTLEKLNVVNKQLRRERSGLNLETKKGRERLREINTSLDQNNAKIKANSDALKKQKLNVGNYGNSLKKATGMLKAFAGGLGLVAGVATVVKIVKDAVKTNIEFEKSLSSLQSITGATTDDMKDYAAAAKEIGRSTTLSAKQAVEGFKLIGSAKPELLANKEALIAVTKEAVTLAEAAELELGVAAQSLAGTLNQFNLEASESNRVINALAAGSKAGAADIPSLNAAIEKTGAVAASMNISLEENIGALETLAEKNIQGAEAGNKLKNVMLVMSTINALPPAALAQLDKFGVDVDKVSDKTVPFQERLEELGKISDDSTALVKVFGKENIIVGQTLLKNAKKVDQYTKAVTGTNVAQEQAAINTDNLDGDLKQMGSAWEGLMLQMSTGNGILRQAVQWLTQLLGVLSGQGSLLDVMPQYIQSWSVAFDSVENFNTAIADTIDFFLGMIPGVKDLTALLFRETKVVKKLTAEQRRNNKVNSQALKIGRELLKQNKEEIADVSVLIDALIDENTTREEKNEIIAKLQEDYPDLISNIDLETASTEALIQVKKDLIKQILVQAIETKKAEAQAALTGRIIELEFQKIGTGKKGIAELDRQIKELTLSLPLVEDIAKKVTENLGKTVDGLDLSSAFREENEEIRELQEELEQLNIELNDAIEADNKQRVEKTKERIAEITKRLELAQGIRTGMLDDALDKQDDINAESVANFKAAEKKKTKIVEDEATKQEKIRRDALSREQQDLEDMLAENADIREKNAETEQERVDRINAGQELFDEQQRAKNKKQLEEEKKARQEAAKAIIKTFEEITAAANANIDSQISKQKQEIKTSEDRITKLEKAAEAGSIEAEESIKAEKQRIAASNAEIADLERKKRNLLMVTTFLKGVSNALDAGDSNAFANVGQQLSQALSGLPTFIEGTKEGTVADALGKPSLRGKDGHIIRVDGKEKILNPKQSAMTGGLSADQIAYGAMMWHGDKKMAGQALHRSSAKAEYAGAAKMDEVVSAVKNIKIIEHHTSVDAMRNTATIVMKDANKIERFHKREGGVFS